MDLQCPLYCYCYFLTPSSFHYESESENLLQGKNRQVWRYDCGCTCRAHGFCQHYLRCFRAYARLRFGNWCKNGTDRSRRVHFLNREQPVPVDAGDHVHRILLRRRPYRLPCEGTPQDLVPSSPLLLFTFSIL